MAKGKAILERIPGQFRAALLDQNEQVVEFHVEYDTDQSVVGGVYFGRIRAFHPALNVAFVDIGQNRDGFLEIRDVFSKGKKVLGNNIRNHLTVGQSIFVCVTRDPVAEKGPKLTMQISLSSRFLVYFPEGEGIKFSKKFKNKEDKQRLTQEIITIMNIGEGVVIRSAAKNVTKNEVYKELISLRDKWRRAQAKNIERKCPFAVIKPAQIEYKLLEVWVHSGIDHIALGGDLAAFDTTLLAHKFFDIKIHREFKICDLFAIYNLKEQLEMALAPCVQLPNGARIFISETPALIAIDVDSGSGQSNGVSSFSLEVNLEAAKAIYQAVRLRGLSGLIVVDFLDMQNQDQYKKVLSCVKKLFSNDQLNTFVGGFTRMGAFEMTRQRIGPSLIENLTKPCDLCGDGGALGQSRAKAFDLVRGLASQIRTTINGPEAIAAPDVKRALQNSARPAFKALERQLGRKLSVETSTEKQPGTFEVLH